MDLRTLISLCSRFEQLGSAVADQAAAVVVDDESLDRQNANALGKFAGFLRAVQREADGELAAEAGEMASELTTYVEGRLARGEVVSADYDEL